MWDSKKAIEKLDELGVMSKVFTSNSVGEMAEFSTHKSCTMFELREILLAGQTDEPMEEVSWKSMLHLYKELEQRIARLESECGVDRKSPSSSLAKSRDKYCPYCGLDTKIANPSGKCSHIYYPDDVNTALKPVKESHLDHFKMGGYMDNPDYCDCGEKKVNGLCPLGDNPVTDEKDYKCPDCGTKMKDGGSCGYYCPDDKCNSKFWKWKKNDKPSECIECKTKLEYADGIGHFCPNPECSALDTQTELAQVNPDWCKWMGKWYDKQDGCPKCKAILIPRDLAEEWFKGGSEAEQEMYEAIQQALKQGE